MDRRWGLFFALHRGMTYTTMMAAIPRIGNMGRTMVGIRFHLTAQALHKECGPWHGLLLGRSTEVGSSNDRGPDGFRAGTCVTPCRRLEFLG
jgi:hypothetical protein